MEKKMKRNLLAFSLAAMFMIPAAVSISAEELEEGTGLDTEISLDSGVEDTQNSGETLQEQDQEETETEGTPDEDTSADDGETEDAPEEEENPYLVVDDLDISNLYVDSKINNPWITLESIGKAQLNLRFQSDGNLIYSIFIPNTENVEGTGTFSLPERDENSAVFTILSLEAETDEIAEILKSAGLFVGAKFTYWPDPEDIPAEIKSLVDERGALTEDNQYFTDYFGYLYSDDAGIVFGRYMAGGSGGGDVSSDSSGIYNDKTSHTLALVTETETVEEEVETAVSMSGKLYLAAAAVSLAGAVIVSRKKNNKS